MTRVELLLFYRYRTAAYIAVVPLFLLFPALTLSGQDNPAGIDAGAFYTASVFILTPITLGIMHMPNVYAARRESMLLKRYRVAGVPASALFGATTLAVSAVVAVLCAVIAAVLVGRFGEAPPTRCCWPSGSPCAPCRCACSARSSPTWRATRRARR
ncbi:hypothetical protein ACFQXA_20605 [Nocardiopsis composta]